MYDVTEDFELHMHSLVQLPGSRLSARASELHLIRLHSY
jgi:hypothetical protein